MRPQGQPVGRMDPAVSKCDWSSGRETYRLWGRWVTWCFPSVDLTQKDRRPDGRAINEILARINAAEPPDGIEAIQAAQTAMIHQATIRAARQTEGFGKFPGRDSNSNSPNQLTRTFGIEVEALERYLSRAELKVIVPPSKNWSRWRTDVEIMERSTKRPSR